MRRLFGTRTVVKLGLFVALVATLSFAFRDNINFASIAYPPIPNSHYKFITDAVDHCKIPEEMKGFVAATAYAESTFHPGSESGAGAVGVMQLLRGTGYGVAQKYQIAGLNASTFTDPAISYKMGTCYLHYLMEEVAGGNSIENWRDERKLEAILVGYNAGPARGRSYLSGAYNGPLSSVGYAKKILRATQVYNLDFARYEQQAQADPTAPLTQVRELVWQVLLRQTTQ